MSAKKAREMRKAATKAAKKVAGPAAARATNRARVLHMTIFIISLIAIVSIALNVLLLLKK